VTPEPPIGGGNGPMINNRFPASTVGEFMANREFILRQPRITAG
jgi:hypothetical protein